MILIEKAFYQDPDEVLDYGFDWAKHLGSDTIDTSIWVVPSGLTKESDTNDSTTTTVVLSGGTSGESYDVVNRITTIGGLTIEARLRICCRSTT